MLSFVPTFTYRIKVGDLEYPAEFSSEESAKGFANGARFVLDNSVPRNATYQSSYDTTVTLITYSHTYDDDDMDVIQEVSRREF